MQIQLFDIVKFTKYPSRLQKILAYFKLYNACEKSTCFLVKDDRDKDVVGTELFTKWVHRSKRDRCELYRLKVRLTPVELGKLEILNDGSLTEERIVELVRPSIYGLRDDTIESIVKHSDSFTALTFGELTEYKKIYDSKKG